jgi:hypothetical protein
LFTFTSENPTRSSSSAASQETGENQTQQLDLKLTPYQEEERNQIKFDVFFYGRDTGDNISFGIKYSSELFKEETLKKFIEYFKEIVSAVKENEWMRLKDITISHDLGVADSDIYESDEIIFEF